MNIKNKNSINIISILFVFCTLLALSFNMEIVSYNTLEIIDETQPIYLDTFTKLLYSLKGYKIIWLIISPVLLEYYKNSFFSCKKSKSIHITAFLFSFFMIFGKSFDLVGSWDLVFADQAQLIKSFIGGIGYYALFYCTIFHMFEFIESNRNKYSTSKKTSLESIFNNFPYLMSFLILIILWLPYLIVHYPGMFMYDTGMQILQSFNIEDSTSKYLNLISEDVKLNNHHPVIHTLLLGGCVKIGMYLFQSENVGYFIYTLVQMLISAGTIAYCIKYMTRKQVPFWFRVGVLAFYSLVPAFVNWAILGTKDTLFTCMILFYVIYLIEMIDTPESILKDKRKVIQLFLILVAISLLRNNGIYVIVLTLPLILFIHKIYLRHIVLVCAGVFTLCFGFNHVLLPSLQITGGSVREALSIPFQQTARYVRDYGYEVTEEEKQVINTILNYNLLAEKYNPDLSDPIKKLYNENATNDDLTNYFRIWFQMLLKRPEVYVQATMNNVYGYFYFSKQATPIYEWTWAEECMNQVNTKGGFQFRFNNSMEPIRIFYSNYSELFKKFPCISLLHSSAIYSWLLMIGVTYAIRKKEYKHLIAYAPLWTLLLFCIISPSNGNRYFRYIYPIAYCLPVVIGVQLSKLIKHEVQQRTVDLDPE